MDFNDDRSNHRMEFEYELEGKYVKAVSVYHDWNKVSYLYPLTGEPLNLLSSILLAQENCGILELAELTELYWQYVGNKTASFDYKNLTIEWTIMSELPMEGVTIFNEGDDAAEAQLYFRITIR